MATAIAAARTTTASEPAREQDMESSMDLAAAHVRAVKRLSEFGASRSRLASNRSIFDEELQSDDRQPDEFNALPSPTHGPVDLDESVHEEDPDDSGNDSGNGDKSLLRKKLTKGAANVEDSALETDADTDDHTVLTAATAVSQNLLESAVQDTTCFERVLCSYADTECGQDRIEKFLCRTDEALCICKISDILEGTPGDSPEKRGADETGSLSTSSDVMSRTSSGIIEISPNEEDAQPVEQAEGQASGGVVSLKSTTNEEEDPFAEKDLNVVASDGQGVQLQPVTHNEKEEEEQKKEEKDVVAERQQVSDDVSVVSTNTAATAASVLAQAFGDMLLNPFPADIEFTDANVDDNDNDNVKEDDNPEVQEQEVEEEACIVIKEKTPAVTTIAPDVSPIAVAEKTATREENSVAETPSVSPAPPGVIEDTKADAGVELEAESQEVQEQEYAKTVEKNNIIIIQEILKGAYKDRMPEEEIIKKSFLLLDQYAGREQLLVAALEDKARTVQPSKQDTRKKSKKKSFMKNLRFFSKKKKTKEEVANF